MVALLFTMPARPYRLVLPALEGFVALFFPFARWLVVLGGNGDDGSVDDLPARSQIAPIFQRAVEVLKHRRDHTGLSQLLPGLPACRIGLSDSLKTIGAPQKWSTALSAIES